MLNWRLLVATSNIEQSLCLVRPLGQWRLLRIAALQRFVRHLDQPRQLV